MAIILVLLTKIIPILNRYCFNKTICSFVNTCLEGLFKEELFALNDFKAFDWIVCGLCHSVSCGTVSSSCNFPLSIIHDEMVLFFLCVMCC